MSDDGARLEQVNGFKLATVLGSSMNLMFFMSRVCEDEVIRSGYAQAENDVTRRGYAQAEGTPHIDRTKHRT